MSQILKPKKGYKKVKWYFGKEIEIPEEWKVLTLKENSFVTDGSHLSPPQVDKGLPMATVENIRDSYLDIESCYRISKKDFKQLTKNNCKPEFNDVLFTKDGTVGKSFVFTQNVDVVLLSSIAILKPFENLDSHYLHYSFHSEAITKFIAKYLGGTAIKRIVLKNLEKFVFPFPPLQEQQKIASILSNIDNLIFNTQKIIDQTILLKKGLMQKLLTKGIGHTKFKKVEWLFGKEIEIPEEWEVVKLHRIVDKIIDMNHRMPKKLSEGIPFLTIGYISKNIHSVLSITPTNSELEYISQKDFEIESKKFNAEKGDILFTRYGTLGITKFIDSNQKFLASYSVALIKIQNSVDGLFLTNFLNSNYVKQQIVFLREQTSNNNLHLSKISQIKIILSPEKEQQKIVSIISNVESQIKSQTQYKEKLERLKKSLMQKLLTGQVRVKV